MKERQKQMKVFLSSQTFQNRNTHYSKLKCGPKLSSTHFLDCSSAAYPSTTVLAIVASALMPSFTTLIVIFRKNTLLVSNLSNFTETSSAFGKSRLSSQTCGSFSYVEGAISEVRVTCGINVCGELKWVETVLISVVRTGVRGCDCGGRSQSDEPGMLILVGNIAVQRRE